MDASQGCPFRRVPLIHQANWPFGYSTTLGVWVHHCSTRGAGSSLVLLLGFRSN